jgi:carbamoylphosphate synthase large subunit
MKTILCLAHTFKGTGFLREAKRQGCKTILLTRERFRESPWPWEVVDEFHTLETLDDVLGLVCQLVRSQRIDLVFGLQEHDVDRAAALREFLCLPGMSSETANRFRDKLCMREVTSLAGIPNPPFVHILHHGAIDEYTREVTSPWMLKPRAEAGAFGIVRVESAAQLWNVVGELGDEASHYLLEQRVHGHVYHVDSLIHQGAVCFAQAHRYGVPPFEVWNRGGVFQTASLHAEDPTLTELLRLNQEVLSALGLENGAAHVEFIECEQGRILFLEAAARVGGANIDVLVEMATGVNLWREWLRIELLGKAYRPPTPRHDSAILMQCLAKQKHPDLEALQGAEIVWKLKLDQHAGVIVASPDHVLAKTTATRCLRELEANHLAVLPPLKVRL